MLCYFGWEEMVFEVDYLEVDGEELYKLDLSIFFWEEDLFISVAEFVFEGGY